MLSAVWVWMCDPEAVSVVMGVMVLIILFLSLLIISMIRIERK
jgi:hypothetical protein